MNVGPGGKPDLPTIVVVTILTIIALGVLMWAAGVFK